MSREIPAGAKCLTPKLAGEKFSKGKSWLWDKVKNDPKFPKPVYLAPMSPVFIESELDAYIAAQAALPITPVSVLKRLQQKAARRNSKKSGHESRRAA